MFLFKFFEVTLYTYLQYFILKSLAEQSEVQQKKIINNFSNSRETDNNISVGLC